MVPFRPRTASTVRSLPRIKFLGCADSSNEGGQEDAGATGAGGVSAGDTFDDDEADVAASTSERLKYRWRFWEEVSACIWLPISFNSSSSSAACDIRDEVE